MTEYPFESFDEMEQLAIELEEQTVELEHRATIAEMIAATYAEEAKKARAKATLWRKHRTESDIQKARNKLARELEKEGWEVGTFPKGKVLHAYKGNKKRRFLVTAE
jgi:hypothetical protein